jgi:hypothetical protein
MRGISRYYRMPLTYLRLRSDIGLSHIGMNAIGRRHCCWGPSLLLLPVLLLLLLLLLLLSHTSCRCLPEEIRVLTLSKTHCTSSADSTFGTTSASGSRFADRTAVRSSAAKPLLTGLMRTAASELPKSRSAMCMWQKKCRSRWSVWWVGL